MVKDVSEGCGIFDDIMTRHGREAGYWMDYITYVRYEDGIREREGRGGWRIVGKEKMGWRIEGEGEERVENRGKEKGEGGGE